MKAGRIGAAVVAGLLVARVSFAAPPSEADVARARSLFAEASRAQAEGDWGRAMPLLQDVIAIKTTPGVLFHLANCEEHLGKLADALRDYERADALAKEQGVADVRRMAAPVIAALRERVPTLTVQLPAATEGLEVRIDGRAVTPESLESLRLDPGEHYVAVRARGRKPFDAKVVLRERGASVILVELAPEAAPVAPTPPPAPPPAPEPQAGVPPGAIACGVGAVALAVGGGVAFAVAGSNNDEAQAGCTSAAACDRDAAESVRALDRAALALWIGAAASAGAAVTLWALDRRERASVRAAGVELSPHRVTFRARF